MKKDIGQLSNQVSVLLLPFLPDLLKQDRLEELPASGSLLNQAGKIWDLLLPHVGSLNQTLLQGVVANDDDVTVQRVLDLQLHKILAEDPALEEAVAALLDSPQVIEETGEPMEEPPTVLGQNHLSFTIKQSITVSGNLTGGMIVTGDGGWIGS